MVEYVYIEVEVNKDGKLGGQWSTSYEGATPNIGNIIIKVEEGSPAFRGDFSGYRYINGELSFSEELASKDRLAIEVYLMTRDFEQMIAGFSVPFKVKDGEIKTYYASTIDPGRTLTDYFLGYVTDTSTYFNEYEGGSNTPSKVTEVTIDEQFHLIAYDRAVKNQMLNKLHNKLVPLMESKETIEEIREVKWDDILDEPLPDQDSVEPDKPRDTPLLKELREIKERLTKLEESKN